MPAQKTARAGRDTMPPAKKTKLSTPARTTRQSAFAGLVGGTSTKKPQAQVNGAKAARKDRVVEATAVVGDGVSGNADVDMADAVPDIIDISSAEEESEHPSDDEDDAAIDDAPAVNGDMDEDAAAPEELSFGEKLQAQEPETERAPRVVDVEAAFVDADQDSRALATASRSRPLSAPSATSLGTVLTQALRTNDKDLLDSCLRVIDVDTIYATVERLPSPLVGSLLQKLAERLYKKPGRAGILMVWVQWSLAAHGGYLASQPQLVKQLATLNKVLKERASGLQPLLSLKGRLDMLQAQLELRRRNQKRAAGNDEDEAVIYVEGQDDISSEDESEAGDDASPRKRMRQGSEDESSDDEMPTTMEVDEDSEDGSEDSEGMLDDEASETDNDTGDDLSEAMSDDGLDEGDDVSGSEDEAKPAETKPARRSTTGRAGLTRRY